MSFFFCSSSLTTAWCADFAPLSSWPFQVSVFFNWLYDRMAQKEVAARQLCHTATGVSRACVSYKMINVLFVTVSNYINELFIINAYIDTVTDKDTSVCCQCCYVSEIWMSEAYFTDKLINVSFMFWLTLWSLCQGLALGWNYSIASP